MNGLIDDEPFFIFGLDVTAVNGLERNKTFGRYNFKFIDIDFIWNLYKYKWVSYTYRRQYKKKWTVSLSVSLLLDKSNSSNKGRIGIKLENFKNHMLL